MGRDETRDQVRQRYAAAAKAVTAGRTSLELLDGYCSAACCAGALSRGKYLHLLAAAGFADAQVEFTHEVADGMPGAIVRAHKEALLTRKEGRSDAASPGA